VTATPPEGPDQPDCPLTQQTIGWALHALEPDEEMAVLLHLPQCAACRAAAHDTVPARRRRPGRRLRALRRRTP